VIWDLWIGSKAGDDWLRNTLPLESFVQRCLRQSRVRGQLPIAEGSHPCSGTRSRGVGHSRRAPILTDLRCPEDAEELLSTCPEPEPPDVCAASGCQSHAAPLEQPDSSQGNLPERQSQWGLCHLLLV